MINYRNKTSVKLISFILAQVFLLTGLIYPESSSSKNISSIYIRATTLRVPISSSNYARMLNSMPGSEDFIELSSMLTKKKGMEKSAELRLYKQGELTPEMMRKLKYVFKDWAISRKKEILSAKNPFMTDFSFWLEISGLARTVNESNMWPDFIIFDNNRPVAVFECSYCKKEVSRKSKDESGIDIYIPQGVILRLIFVDPGQRANYPELEKDLFALALEQAVKRNAALNVFLGGSEKKLKELLRQKYGINCKIVTRENIEGKTNLKRLVPYAAEHVAISPEQAGELYNSIAGQKRKSIMAEDLDEAACRQLSSRIVQELGLIDVKNQLPKDAKLRCGSKEYVWEKWRGNGPGGETFDLKAGNQFVYFMRIRHLFFLDESKYQGLDDELKNDLGANVIRIRNLYDTDLARADFLGFTMATVVAMLRNDIAGKRIIDAGAGNGILALVAVKLGVLQAVLIEKEETRVKRASANLNINGLTENVDYKMIHADIEDTDNIAGMIPSTELETVIVSNIGTWPGLYNITNIDTMRLITKIPNVVIFIGGGYSLGGTEEKIINQRREIFTNDRNMIEKEYNFRVESESLTAVFELFYEGSLVQTVAWAAKAEDKIKPDAVRVLSKEEEALRSAI